VEQEQIISDDEEEMEFEVRAAVSDEKYDSDIENELSTKFGRGNSEVKVDKSGVMSVKSQRMVTGKEIVAEGDGEGHLNVKGAVDEEDDKMRSRNDWRKPMDADEAPYNVLQVIIIPFPDFFFALLPYGNSCEWFLNANVGRDGILVRFLLRGGFPSFWFIFVARTMRTCSCSLCTWQAEHVYGFRGHDCRNNLMYTKTGKIVYMAAAICVVYTKASHLQVRFRVKGLGLGGGHFRLLYVWSTPRHHTFR